MIYLRGEEKNGAATPYVEISPWERAYFVSSAVVCKLSWDMI